MDKFWGSKSVMICMLLFLLLVIGGGVAFYVRSVRFNDTSVTETSKNPDALVSNITSSSNTDSWDRLYARFVFLENELETVRINRMYFSAEHAQRIQDELTKLQQDGYLTTEIERLRTLVREMSPKTQGISQTDNPQGECISNENPVFSRDITDLNSIIKITPPGIVTSDGVLKSHSYIWNKDGAPVPVYAPVTMKLTSGAFYSEGNTSQYVLFFSVSCEVQIKFDHVLDPVPAIQTLFLKTPKVDSQVNLVSEPLLFPAGELIGYTSGTPQNNSWNFAVYNKARPMTELSMDGMEANDTIANCPFDYYPLEQREVYYSLFNYGFNGGAFSVQYCK